MKLPWVLALAVAATGCTGQSVAVLATTVTPDGGSDGATDGTVLAHDGSADASEVSTADAGGEEQIGEAGADAFESGSEAATDGPVDEQASDGPQNDASDGSLPDAGDGEASIICPSSCNTPVDTYVSGQCDTGSSCLPPSNSNITCVPRGVQVPYCTGTTNEYPCCIVGSTGCDFYACPPGQ